MCSDIGISGIIAKQRSKVIRATEGRCRESLAHEATPTSIQIEG